MDKRIANFLNTMGFEHNHDLCLALLLLLAILRHACSILFAIRALPLLAYAIALAWRSQAMPETRQGKRFGIAFLAEGNARSALILFWAPRLWPGFARFCVLRNCAALPRPEHKRI